MTGFATTTGRVSDQLGFALTLKSVNHRFFDPHFRLPTGCDALEMELRRLLKESIHRGHVEVTVQIDRTPRSSIQVNMAVVRAHVEAFRIAASDLKVNVAPDLNAILRMPGALSADAVSGPEDATAMQAAVIELLPALVQDLNAMREQEGITLATELRAEMGRILAAVSEVRLLRSASAPQIATALRERLQTLLADVPMNEERILTEAAILAERGDVDEEMVRLDAHVHHFLQILNDGGEVGKRLDFLLQEFNREANTLLSKTGGASHSLRITELGLEIKSEIERAREQVQNLE